MTSSDMSFYKVGQRGTIRATSKYDPEKAVETLYLGMKGLGTDEDAIIDVVATHTFNQRQELKLLYRHKYGKDLIKELDSELSFSFLKTVLALMTRPERFIIECIHQAASKSKASRLLKHLQKIYKKGLGSDEYTLIALLCPRSNRELEAMKALYKKTYHRDLEDDVGYDLGDDLRSLILDMISGDRECEDPDIGVNAGKVLEDADNLHGASFVPVGEIYGTKERVFQQIMNMRSYEHLRKFIPAYEELANKSIEEYIENTGLSQDLKEAYLAIIKILKSEPDFYAERLRDAISGLGTDDDTLISIVVLRSEIDLRDIMDRYYSKFGVTLMEDVVGDTSGDYRHILLKILEAPEVDEEIVQVEKRKSLFQARTEEDEPEEITIMEAENEEGKNPKVETAVPVLEKIDGMEMSTENAVYGIADPPEEQAGKVPGEVPRTEVVENEQVVGEVKNEDVPEPEEPAVAEIKPAVENNEMKKESEPAVAEIKPAVENNEMKKESEPDVAAEGTGEAGKPENENEEQGKDTMDKDIADKNAEPVESAPAGDGGVIGG